MLEKAADARRSVSRGTTNSSQTTPNDSPYSDHESFSSFSESENERPRRRKAVGGKRATKKTTTRNTCVIKEDKPKKETKSSKPPIKESKTRVAPKRKQKPEQATTDEIVHIAKKDGSTKFQQMRKFLEKANEAEKPTDMLSGFLSKDRLSSSPIRLPKSSSSPPRSSVGCMLSPRIADFHTGLTPKASNDFIPSFLPMPVSRRDSDDGFAASDLFVGSGETATNKIGSFIHGQRGMNLRKKMAASSAMDTTALLLEEIVDVEEKLAHTGKDEIRRRILLNTAENEEEEAMAAKCEDDDIMENDMSIGM